jgi:hypothetical protein
MANLTFANLLTEVYAHTGLDSGDATNIANATRWLNYVQQDLCARWPWPFMLSRESVVTIPDVTGTVSTVTIGSTAVTVDATVDATFVDRYIQFSTANDWYRIATVTPPNDITIEQGYLWNGTTTPPPPFLSLSYTIRKFFYSLSSAADEVIDVRNWDTPVKMVQVDLRFIDDLRPNPQSTNSSYGYMMFGYDASNNLRFSPYPFPSDSRLFEFRIKKRPTDDAVSVPNKYAHVLAWGAISVAFAYERKFDLATVWNRKFEDRISQMKKEYRQSEDFTPILRSIDSVQRSKWVQLPEMFPVITSG